MNGDQNEGDVSPFLTLELKAKHQAKKSNDISDRQNGLEPTEQIGTGKEGSPPFLGTIRLFAFVRNPI